MTKTTAPHPAAERLTSFSWGKLDDAESSEIAAHLVTCADCQKAVETLPDDALVSLVRKVVTKTLAKASTVTLVESWIPTELLAHPRYRLVRWLGAGGMGVVYQAEHRLMERPVAIKIISKTLTDNANTVARFQKEVKAAAKLSHPNIVTAYDAEQAGDLHFLVMEFIEGKSLNRLVEDGVPLPVKLACKYVRQAALGLQHAFEQGLVHRDIKPQNLMLTPKGQVKILDFGLAGFVTESGPVGSLTESGQGLGTPDYIAPEQIRDTHSADIRADIYSLGCTLYCLLTGQPPFPDGSASQKLVAHLERMPKDISSLRPDLPVELALIVERMMEKRPAHRYQNPFEVAEALAPFAKGDDKVRPGSNSSHPSKLKAYLICAGVLGGVIGCIFLFDLPGKLSPFGKPQQASVVPKEEKEKGVEVPKEAKEIGVVGPPVDLLQLINPAKDAWKGDWKFQGRALISPTDGVLRLLRIPYIPPAEYRIRMEVKRLQGDNLLCVGLIGDGRQFLAIFDGWPEKDGLGVSGLHLIDKKQVVDQESPRRQVLAMGKTTELLITVRKSEVIVEADGKLLQTFKGDFNRMSLEEYWSIPNKDVLFLGSHTPAVFQITKMDLTPISGQGKVLALQPFTAK